MYRIINAQQTAAQYGEFNTDQIGELFDDKKYKDDKVNPARYPSECYGFIAEAMSEFELCYRFPDQSRQKSYLIPDLLPVEENDGGFDKEGCARLMISYPGFLPPSIFPRFIVQMNPWLVKENCWRTGVRLSHAEWNAEGLVLLERKEKKIKIFTAGKEARRLMGFIRDTLKLLNEGFKELKTVEQVPLTKGYSVSYEALVSHERRNIPEYFCGELDQFFKVAELLNGIEFEQRRIKDQRPVQIFLSYSRAHPAHKRKFETHMAWHTKSGKVKIWVDERMDADQILDPTLERALRESQIVVCLLSPEYIESPYCYELEFSSALKLEAEDKLSLVLVQVVSNGWYRIPEMKKKLVIPDKPIASMGENIDGAWDQVVGRLDPIIEKWHQRINTQRKDQSNPYLNFDFLDKFH